MPDRRLKTVEHWGKKIIILDFSHASYRDAMKLMERASGVIRTAPSASHLTLSDVSPLSYDTDLIAAFKDFTAGNKPHVKAAAIVGLRGVQKIVFNAIAAFSNRTFGVFPQRPEALDWLVRQ